MTLSLMQIILLLVAAVSAFLGLTTGKKLGKREGEKIGREKAVTEIKHQSTEQVLERVQAATEARNDVQRTPDRELSEQASRDPNNRLSGM